MDEKVATQIMNAFSEGEYAPTTQPPPNYLIVVSGSIPGAMLRLVPTETRLGRSPDNTFPLPDRCISRHHAVLRADPNGTVWLTDLASTNGTCLNGRRLDDHTPVRLKDGDRIQLSSTVVLKFVRLDPCEEQFQREMYERTVRDGLTNLYNRSYFLNQVGALADLGAARGLGMGVLLLDLDHFKRINDTHGHDAGDVVLREVAAVLRESTRAEDLVARYGGEEFILALPVAAPDQATERAERIRLNLASRRIHAERVPLRVTASLGLAYLPPGTVCAPSELIRSADRSLYQAKNSGRNRLVFRHDANLCHEEPSTSESRSVGGKLIDRATPAG